mgnify:CR=1 FL=1
MPITLTYSPLITQTPTLSVPDGDSAAHCVHYSSFIIHHSSLSFTFSAKERDSETGLSYFGSRYYSSDLSIWLSVDPMAAKYASLSPYVYCVNNPVILVDPNGEDTIFINKKTGHPQIKESDGKDVCKDVLVCGSHKVTLSGNGVFAQAKGDENQSNDSQILLTGLSKKDAVKVFNFMADNTNFEWGFLEISEGDISSYIVGSAYESDVETLIYDQALNAKPGSVVCYDHSHWDNNTHWGGFPSTSETSKDSNNNDISAWKKLLLNNPKATLGIRFKNKTVPYVIEGYAPQRYYRLLLEQ